MFQLWVGVLLALVVIALFRETLFPPALEDEIAAYEGALSGAKLNTSS